MALSTAAAGRSATPCFLHEILLFRRLKSLLCCWVRAYARIWVSLLLLTSRAAAGEPGRPLDAGVVRDGLVTVIHAEGDAGLARAAAAIAAASHERIRAELGLEHRMQVAVLLLTAHSPDATHEEWARRLPAWIAGAAISGRQLIVIRVRPGQTPHSLEPLLSHELTHVILRTDYASFGDWPLWFQEGLAMRESRTEGLREYLTLSAATLLGRMLPFESLAVRFPGNEAEARLAYAQSASFLAFLDTRLGRGRFPVLMRELRVRRFEEAFRVAYGASPGAAETLWLRWANQRYAWVPSLTSDAVLWLLITVLCLVAIAVHRRRSRIRRERWEDEEREVEPES